MLKYLIAVICFISAPGALAQTSESTIYPDKNLDKLINDIRNLQNKGTREQAYSELKNNLSWTLMDELPTDKANECKITEKVSKFGINDVAWKIFTNRDGAYNDGGVFCNGADPRYDYSVYEKSLKGGSAVSYEVTKRNGKQIFAFFPCRKASKFAYSVKVKRGETENEVDDTVVENGITYFIINEALTASDIITITIQNNNNTGEAVAIANYNSKKR